MRIKKMSINNKFFKTVCLSTIIFASHIPLSVNAESNIDLLLKDKDYIQQQEIVNSKIKSNNESLAELNQEYIRLENDLNDTYEEVMALNTSYKNTKALYNKGYGDSKKDTLKLFDMVLGSESVSDLLKNIDLAKNIIIQQNKELKNKEIQEDMLIEKQEELLNECEKIVSKQEEIKTENVELENAKNEIDKKINRKGELHFNANNVLEVSNASLADIQRILKGTALYELAPTYLEVENTYGVNALFIIALSAHESSWGTSKRAVEDNNLTGFGVFYDSSVGLNSNSKRANIIRTTSWLKNQYLIQKGAYYKGTSIVSINQSYAKNADGSVNTEWSQGITAIANGLYNKLIQ